MTDQTSGKISLGENLQASGPRCRHCRMLPGEHVGSDMRCMKVSHYSPCEHRNQIGRGAISTDGSGWSDSTCQDCGERFTSGKVS